MKILLTGAAGFIGSHLCRRLIEKDHEVLGIDNFDPFYDRTLKESNLLEIRKTGRFEFHEIDIRDVESLTKMWQQRGPFDVVVHLAALAGVRPSLKAPGRYTSVNVQGTVNILELLREKPETRLVFASSSSVYGKRSQVPFDEEDPCNQPASPYAATKRCGELLSYTYNDLYGIDTVCLRFFTVYGPRQRPEMAIADFVRRVAHGEPVTLYGDGSSARDYTFIADIIDGTAAAVEKGPPGFHILNLGGSRTVSLLQLVESIESALGVKAKKVFQPDQPGDVPITCAKVDKAGEILGYSPKIRLKEGLEEYVAWAREMKIIPKPRD